MDIELYTRERLHTAIERMRKSTEELNRVLAILNENNARTLKDDLENFENRIAGRRLNQVYVQAVCNAFYVTTKSKLHSALLEAVVAEPTSQKLLDNMIGKYEAYWPASHDKFDKFPMEISYADDTYTVSDRTIGKSKIQFGHLLHPRHVWANFSDFNVTYRSCARTAMLVILNGLPWRFGRPVPMLCVSATGTKVTAGDAESTTVGP
jgi:hypothetical protein